MPKIKIKNRPKPTLFPEALFPPDPGFFVKVVEQNKEYTLIEITSDSASDAEDLCKMIQNTFENVEICP